MSRHVFAPGKIILSGDYAVVFGYPGIAFPASAGIDAEFREEATGGKIDLAWESEVNNDWIAYAKKIIAHCRPHAHASGRLSISSSLPLQKGMGSSTALVIAITRALVGEHARGIARSIEDTMNPGHSGLDFACIWESVPIVFRQDAPVERSALPPELHMGGILIDTGAPSDATSTLVAWMKEREGEARDALGAIGNCTERLIAGESLIPVVRDHHRAQTQLGVVPRGVRELIASIEKRGGAAKVIGSGSRSGGGGMVLALGEREEILNIAREYSLPTMSL